MTVLTHRYRKDAFSKERTLSISDTALIEEGPKQRREIPFAEIEVVKLGALDVMQTVMGETKLRTKQGKLDFRSHSFVKMATFEDRTASYAPFVALLLHSVHAANPQARFEQGSSSMRIFWFVMAGVLAALAVLLAIASIATQDLSVGGAAGLVTLGLALSWRNARLNKPAQLNPLAPPQALLYPQREG